MNMNTSIIFLLSLVICVFCDSDVQEVENVENVNPVKEVKIEIEGSKPVIKEAITQLKEFVEELGDNPSSDEVMSAAEKKFTKFFQRKTADRGNLDELISKHKPYWEQLRGRSQESLQSLNSELKERLAAMKTMVEKFDASVSGRVFKNAGGKVQNLFEGRSDEEKVYQNLRGLRHVEKKLRSFRDEGRIEGIEELDDFKELNKQLVALRKKILEESVRINGISRSASNKEGIQMFQNRARQPNDESRQAISMGSPGRKPGANAHHRGKQMRRPNQFQHRENSDSEMF